MIIYFFFNFSHLKALGVNDSVMEAFPPARLRPQGSVRIVLHGAWAPRNVWGAAAASHPYPSAVRGDLAVMYLLQLPSLFPEEEKIDE